MSPEPISKEPARTVEVVRKPGHVLLINLASSHQSQVQEVLGLLDGHNIQDWPIYQPPQEVGGVFKVDDIEVPKFFAKERYYSSPLDLGERLYHSREALRYATQALVENEGTEMEDDSLHIKNEKAFRYRQDLARSSIANEISTAPIVKRVLGNLEARDLVAGSGFSSIEFVEPLVGIIDRFGKTLVYEFVDGRQMDDLSISEQQGLRQLAGGLVDLFLGSGLVPADLNVSQFLVGQNGKVYMLDTELYFKD